MCGGRENHLDVCACMLKIFSRDKVGNGGGYYVVFFVFPHDRVEHG